MPWFRQLELWLRWQSVVILRTIAQELPGDGELGLDVARGQETVVTDPDEPRREDVESEAAKKLESIEGKELLLLSVGVVTVMEGDLSRLE